MPVCHIARMQLLSSACVWQTCACEQSLCRPCCFADCMHALVHVCAGQFGPNATTWLLPGEVFPTDIRATCHGISAATGKVGALVAGIWFAYLSNANKFYVAAFFNLVRAPPARTCLSCTAWKGLTAQAWVCG